jgi:hypothetical protein
MRGRMSRRKQDHNTPVTVDERRKFRNFGENFREFRDWHLRNRENSTPNDAKWAKSIKISAAKR